MEVFIASVVFVVTGNKNSGVSFQAKTGGNRPATS